MAKRHFVTLHSPPRKPIHKLQSYHEKNALLSPSIE